MNTVLTVSVTVIAVVSVLSLIFSIPVYFRFRRTVREIEKLVDAVRAQVAPISRDIGLLSRDVRDMVQSIHRQVGRVEDGVEIAHSMASRAKEFQGEIERKLEEPLLELASVLGGIKAGIEAAVRIFRRQGT